MSIKSRLAKSAVALSVAGLTMIAGYEGLRTQAYVDPVGVVTICYGHTKTAKLGQSKSKDECVDLLHEEAKEYVDAVKRYTYVPLSQGQLDALVSFSYNVGVGAYKSSTLRRKLNASDYCGAASEFPRWNKAGGKVYKGLTLRRLEEQRRFKEGLQCPD